MVACLDRMEEGRRFLREFQAYLDEFGWRSDGFELADPTWRENPRIPLEHPRLYGAWRGGRPDVRFREAVQTRARQLDEARQRLAEIRRSWHVLTSCTRWPATIWS